MMPQCRSNSEMPTIKLFFINIFAYIILHFRLHKIRDIAALMDILYINGCYSDICLLQTLAPPPPFSPPHPSPNISLFFLCFFCLSLFLLVLMSQVFGVTNTRTRKHTQTHARTRIHVHARTRTHTRTHTHAHARTRTHAHTHTHTHTHVQVIQCL